MDQYGRLTRLEMREAVRRRIDTIRATIAPVQPPPTAPVIPGDETAILQLDPLVSNQDINLMLNTAVIKRSVDVNVLDNTIMADEAIIDVSTGVVEYPLPEDLMFLRGVYWKPPELSIVDPIPPPGRIFLYEQDSDNDISFPLIQGNGIPQYRRRLNNIVLNQVPQEDNPAGLLIDYTKAFLALATDDQYLETPLAQIIQEVVILDVVIEITTERMKLDGTEVRTSLAQLEEKLTLAVTNYHAPKTIRMMSPVTVVRPPFGRRNLIWSRRTWWG